MSMLLMKSLLHLLVRASKYVLTVPWLAHYYICVCINSPLRTRAPVFTLLPVHDTARTWYCKNSSAPSSRHPGARLRNVFDTVTSICVDMSNIGLIWSLFYVHQRPHTEQK
jgi:hypothetical protein